MFEPLETAVRSFASGDKAASRFGNAQSMVILAANVAIIIAVGITVVTLAFAFVQFAMSRGDEKLLKKAQSSATWSVIGLVVVLIAFALKDILVKLIGANGI
ncbi:hypothetical protein GYA37_02640 [candidate division WWE3 bacterium]|uniref:Uncharacterized protein n=1 Tax=candidate division WWE3 bacterium TaxID=2053526 RepID=A0A7X9E792_UNCKA|nr:hypothetical protein [candidate division WWE3 bacterium]